MNKMKQVRRKMMLQKIPINSMNNKSTYSRFFPNVLISNSPHGVKAEHPEK